VPLLRPLLRKSPLCWIILATALAVVLPRAAQAEALLLIDAESGKVLKAENATMPWHPASLSKLMTAYVTLTAVKQGRITLDTLFTVSPNAASQAPSKMGFRPGTQLTVDNALKMMLVKSANDMAVVLAEGVGGSIDGFSTMMNDTAQQLGMTQTSYVNPNGLPADGQITSARDMAILARAFIHNLPEYEYFVHIPSIRLGRRITQNYNKLIGRYPGADGFKTGFICASGYNLMASATRDGRRLIAVVLGASSGQMRAVRAAQLLDSGFASNSLSWLQPSLGTVDKLVPVDAPPMDLHEEMCGPKHHRQSDEDEEASAGVPAGATFFAAAAAAAQQSQITTITEMLAQPPAPSDPIPVYTGPTKTGAALIAATAPIPEPAAARPKGKKARVAARKPEATADTAAEKKESKKDNKKEADSEAKATTAKSVRHANAKPEGTDAAAAEKPAAKPAKPKAVAKTIKPAAKPAPKNPTGDAGKPAG
jgi:D-alanyl-D-alanine carboxypeptidase